VPYMRKNLQELRKGARRPSRPFKVLSLTRKYRKPNDSNNLSEKKKEPLEKAKKGIHFLRQKKTDTPLGGRSQSPRKVKKVSYSYRQRLKREECGGGKNGK